MNPDRPSLLLVFDGPDPASLRKIAVNIDYRIKRVSGVRNVAVSGRIIDTDGIAAQIGTGKLVLLEGKL